MKLLKKISLLLAMSCAMSVPFIGSSAAESVQASAETVILTAKPTGFTKASDVVYKTTDDGIVYNWGARGEASTFLSTKAVAFYSGDYVYDTLSQKSGSASQDSVPSSALYKSLQTLMESKHSHKTTAKETNNLYCYTDSFCNDSTYISSFYSGVRLNGTWDSGQTWNKEHTWPNSKGLNGSDENDIMMLRPTWVSENSSRGNTAYGESGGYYDPDKTTNAYSGVSSVRGDCARIVLYTYVRWGNTGKMWGADGVIENMEILLKWMEEDPVDTWEMGRNDAVQSITGTRNVFIDYPEYAWLLFGQELPTDLSTPSSEMRNTVTVDPVDPPKEEPEDENEQSSAQTSDTAEAEDVEGVESSADGSDGSEGESLLAGCVGSVEYTATAIALALLCAYVVKKKRFTE